MDSVIEREFSSSPNVSVRRDDALNSAPPRVSHVLVGLQPIHHIYTVRDRAKRFLP